MARRFKVGVQLHPQHTTMADLRGAWERADDMGLDSVWSWDHFLPLFGEPRGPHFEGMTVLAAMAATTTTAQVGLMVTCNSYRNPDLLADMIRTVDHLSDGRACLGIGSGWFEPDYDEYGYDFKTPIGRLDDLAEALPRIKARFENLNPAPVGDIPILIGGSGEKVTLRLVAQYADSWNTFGPPESWAAKNDILTAHCNDLGRDPAEVERTVCVGAEDVDRFDAYADVGADHLIMMLGHPFDFTNVEALLESAES